MNHMRTLIAVIVAGALTLGGCQRYGAHGHGTRLAQADVDRIVEAIKADETKWSNEFQAKPKSLDALVAHYAPDAFFVAPGVAPANGIVDIRKTYEEGLKDPNFNIRFSADDVRVADAGDLAVSRGRFTESYTDPATKQSKSDEGTFLTVYKKQDDGSWKAVEDWAVANPPAAQ